MESEKIMMMFKWYEECVFLYKKNINET